MCYNKVKLKYSEVNKVFKLMHGNDSGAVSTRYFFSISKAVFILQGLPILKIRLNLALKSSGCGIFCQ